MERDVCRLENYLRDEVVKSASLTSLFKARAFVEWGKFHTISPHSMQPFMIDELSPTGPFLFTTNREDSETQPTP
jgi:hypothetical protein